MDRKCCRTLHENTSSIYRAVRRVHTLRVLSFFDGPTVIQSGFSKEGSLKRAYMMNVYVQSKQSLIDNLYTQTISSNTVRTELIHLVGELEAPIRS